MGGEAFFFTGPGRAGQGKAKNLWGWAGQGRDINLRGRAPLPDKAVGGWMEVVHKESCVLIVASIPLKS